MKKTLIALVFGFSVLALSAQSPQGFNYQAVARTASGQLLASGSLSLRISILDGSITGSAVYSETHSVITNSLGLFTLVIGKGSIVSGNFSKINWGSGDKFLRIEMDSGGSGSYVLMGAQQLVSVPYALYAQNAGNAHAYQPGNGISISNDSISNIMPDQKVSLTGTGNTSVSGTYPNFTIASSDSTMWKRSGASDIYYNTGNVGIGTAAPTDRLHILGTHGSTIIHGNTMDMTSTYSGDGAAIFMKGYSSPNTWFMTAGPNTGTMPNNFLIASLKGSSVTNALWIDTNNFVKIANYLEAGSYVPGPTGLVKNINFNSKNDGSLVFGIAVNYGTVEVHNIYNTTTSAEDFYTTFNTTEGGVSAGERMRIAPNGNVGINTTSPSEKLSVKGKIESTSGGFKFPDATVQTTAATPGFWKMNGSYLYYKGIPVGINTSFPDTGAALTIQKDFYRNTHAANQLEIRSNADTNQQLLIGYNSGLKFGSIQAITQGKRMDNLILESEGGKIGIGTISPAATLHIKGNWDGSNGALTLEGDKPSIRFNSQQGANKNSKWLQHVGTGASLQFFHGYDGSNWGNPVMVIDTSGNVGVGTTTPSSKLHVVGTYGSVNVTGNFVQITSSVYAYGAELTLQGASSPYVWGFTSQPKFTGLTGKLSFTQYGPGGHKDAMTIDSGRNVGIGTTSPSERLSVSGKIESTSGGFKFPDGTVQTTAAQSASLKGGGATTITGTYPNLTISSSDSTIWKRNGSGIYYNSGYVSIHGGNLAGRLSLKGKDSIGGEMPVWITGDTKGLQYGKTTYGRMIRLEGKKLFDFGVDSFGNYFATREGNYTSPDFLISNGGKVGIGTTSPSEKLSVSGNICYTGSIGSCSDRRYKTNIVSMGGMLSKVMALEPVYYDWRIKEFPDKNFSDRRQIGFIAQDIEKLFPELVLTDDKGYKSVDYSKVTPILVQAVKDQQKEIEELKAQNALILQRLDSINKKGEGTGTFAEKK